MIRSSLALCALLLSCPALAQDPLAPLPDQPPQTQPPASPTAQPESTPTAPTPTMPAAPLVRVPSSWGEVFQAIRGGRWAEARAGINALPRAVLTPVARAELYTARNSPVVGLDQLQGLLAEAPELPHAEQLTRMAVLRGALTPPAYVPPQRIVTLATAPGRNRARPIAGEPAADQLRLALDPLIEADDAPNAELLLLQAAPTLSFEARAEAGQRVAWTYYRLNRDADARRVADQWRVGAQGEWGVHSAWISGLASWRQGDCQAASRAFAEVGATARERELSAAGFYWAARAEQACRRPRSVAPLLRRAAQSPESFYGLLARETLGMSKALPAVALPAGRRVDELVNVRRAAELARIGERGLAEEMLRHQAKIGSPADQPALIDFARRLELVGAQYWLAGNGQPGVIANPADRYPNPKWTPLTGWRVDPALAFAHIIQESSFRVDAVSPAGAVGLMQVRPGTAEDMARARGIAFSRAQLTDPRYNLEFGQSFIELVRAMPATGGQLPRVIAAYNAGPVPVARWWSINDRSDPLLWIESLPYWETRYYVPAVLRNMWVYQGLNQAPQPTLSALAQHRWPAFPAAQTPLRH